MKSKNNKREVWVLEMHFDGEGSRHKKWEALHIYLSQEKAEKEIRKMFMKGHGNVRLRKYVPAV